MEGQLALLVVDPLVVALRQAPVEDDLQMPPFLPMLFDACVLKPKPFTTQNDCFWPMAAIHCLPDLHPIQTLRKPVPVRLDRVILCIV